MKKLYTLLVLLTIPFSINSQTYHPILDSVNEWRYVADIIGVRIAFQTADVNQPCNGYPFNFYETAVQYTNGDTVINSVTYKKLVMGEPNWNNDCLYGFVREDTAARKFYFKDFLNSPEQLLYDFSMQVGDTIVENFYSPNGYFQNGNFILTAITNMTIDAGSRRVFRLHNPAGGADLIWIESVGSIYDLAYTYSTNGYGNFHFGSCTTLPHDGYELLTCFHHAGRVYYDSCAYHSAMMDGCMMVQDTCNYWNICGAIHENHLISDYEVSPNPSNGNMTLNLSLNEKTNVTIQLFDLSGRELKKEIELNGIGIGNSAIPLDFSGLANGTYFLKIIAAGDAVTTNVVISR